MLNKYCENIKTLQQRSAQNSNWKLVTLWCQDPKPCLQHSCGCKNTNGVDVEMHLAVPALACESWPIRADWAFWEGVFKELWTNTRAFRQRVNGGAASMDSMRRILQFVKNKHFPVDTKEKRSMTLGMRGPVSSKIYHLKTEITSDPKYNSSLSSLP